MSLPEHQKMFRVSISFVTRMLFTGCYVNAASSVVYVFDVVPKSHQLSGAVEKGGATATKASEGAGLSERQKVQLLSANSIVIDIVCNADSNNTVLVVSVVWGIYMCF